MYKMKKKYVRFCSVLNLFIYNKLEVTKKKNDNNSQKLYTNTYIHT